MKIGLLHLTHDDTYGPGTDLAMALVGIFILYVALTLKHKSEETVAFRSIQEHQKEVIRRIADIYAAPVDFQKNNKDTIKTHIIRIDDITDNNIIIKNNNSIQTIAFGDNLLFAQGQAQLKEKGKEVIGKVGHILKMSSTHFEEIQIQGHADNVTTTNGEYKSNLELASARATTVFKYLRDYATLDPAQNLMSIVSFGEYKPVERTNNGQTWNMDLINKANDTKEKQDKNRRIEIVLIYR